MTVTIGLDASRFLDGITSAELALRETRSRQQFRSDVAFQRNLGRWYVTGIADQARADLGLPPIPRG